MTDRPVIFSTPMVRALLDGRKTQTRRVLKPQPFPVGGPFYRPFPAHSPREWHSVSAAGMTVNIQKVPYAPGDRLYVREAWRTPTSCNGNAAALERDCAEAGYKTTWAPIQYEACGSRANWEWADFVPGRYRHARFMPRWASRLTLLVTDVRVQRLQEISNEDAAAEGCPGCYAPAHPDHGQTDGRLPWEEFRDLWTSLHGPDAWDANPWVAAISFTVERRNIDAVAP